MEASLPEARRDRQLGCASQFCSTCNRCRSGRDSIVNVGRAKLIEASEARTAALELSNPRNHSSAALPFYMCNDDLAVGRLGDACGNLGYHGWAVPARRTTVPSRQGACSDADRSRAQCDLASHCDKITSTSNIVDPSTAKFCRSRQKLPPRLPTDRVGADWH